MGGTDLGASEERRRLTLAAPLGLADVPALCDRAERLLKEGHDAELECDVAAVQDPDLATVEALARVELTAVRLGGGISLSGASVELLELLAFCGLPIELALEAEGQPEQREEARGIEEEGDPSDPVA
jgi:ABC-type transporter Mla MlaB component